MSHRYHPHPEDQQQPQSGKVENDSNKQGGQAPTQKNEGQRTPDSRSDRQNHIGGTNQHQVRTGTSGQGDKGGPNSRTG